MRNVIRLLTTLMILLIYSVNGAWAQFEYVFPMNGAVNEFPGTHLILRNGALMDESSVTADKIILTGSQSGNVPANVVLSTDGKTICITPAIPFKYTETVTVNVKDGLKTLDGQVLTGTSFNFSIRRQATEEELQQLQEYLLTHDEDGNLKNDPNQQSVYVPCNNTERDNNLKFINIYTNNNPAPGEIFFHRNSGTSPLASTGIGYGIMTSSGDSIFYRATATDGPNFGINLNGYLTAYKLDPGVDTGVLVLDSSYNIIDEVHGQNGLAPSQHEHLFFPNGTKWLTIYDWQEGWDLENYGGPQSSTVNVSWIQELDANNNVIFQWRSDQHFVITDAATDIMAQIGAPTFDPWHINSMYLDNDGKLIASFRNMDMIVKINPSNGSIIWYWGGNNPSYFPLVTTTNDPNVIFSHPHNIHRIANGNIMMFDNGNLHSPQVSQPKEYTLNETTFAANMVWIYSHPQVSGYNMYTKNQGNVTRLPNGNTFIGYGLPNIQGLPNGTEIDINKNIVWEFRFKDSTEYSYRVYKDLWSPNVGIADVYQGAVNLQVFPNPSNGLINLNLDVPLAGKVTIAVSNLLGQTVFTKTESYPSGTHSTAIDLTAIEKGFYIIHVSAGDVKMVGRVLIQ